MSEASKLIGGDAGLVAKAEAAEQKAAKAWREVERAMSEYKEANREFLAAAESMKVNPTDGLEWYMTRCNNGRGALTAEAKRLLQAGYISRKWTSSVTWVLQITEKGRAALAGAEGVR